MKYLFSLLILIIFSFSSPSALAYQYTTAVNCDYCTAKGKLVRALDSAIADGQRVWVIDQQGDEFVLDEFQVISVGSGEVGQYDDFEVSHKNTHSKSSTLAQSVSRAYKASRDAVNALNKEISHIQLDGNDEFKSAFQIMNYSQQFATQMSYRVMNDTKIKKQFDIIDAQTQQLKANLSISLPFLGTSLSLANTITIKFSDGTSAVMNVVLTTSNGTNVRMALVFAHALDIEGNVIPVKSAGLQNYRAGDVLTSENTGDMGYVTEWFRNLEIRGVKITVNAGAYGSGSGGSTEIIDCSYVITRNAKGEYVAQLVCS